MKDEAIPEEHHVLRHCPGRKVDENGQPTAAAFEPRVEKGERGLSVSWLEFFGTDGFYEQLDKVRGELSSRLKLAPSHRLGLLNVGGTQRYVQEHSEDNRLLDFVHRPRNANDSHSEILGTIPEQKLISRLIANTVISSHSAKP